jgi:hypothetical protein
MEFRLRRSDGSAIDATFSAHQGATWTEIVIASSGGSPGEVINAEYTDGLETLLDRLAALDTTIVGVVLSSGPQSTQSIARRLIELEHHHYPIQLSSSLDVPKLRADITRGSSRTLSESDGGGNPRRRLSILAVAGPKNATLGQGSVLELLTGEAV